MLSAESRCITENQDVIKTEDSLDHDEYQYLDLIRKIMKRGKTREDRTGTNHP